MNYAGYYINLDRNLGRRQDVEKQLEAYNLQQYYRRHPASLGNVLNLNAPKVRPGAIGCFTSHYLLLQALRNTSTHVHIVEDDILFGPSTGMVIDSLVRSGDVDKWDMLYTDVMVPPDVRDIRDLSALFRECTTLNPDGTLRTIEGLKFINLKGRVFASTVSYVVNKNSVNKIADILGEAIQGELTLPIDLYYRRQIHQGRITAACIFPFATSVNPQANLISNISDTADRNLQRSLLATTMLRNLFFLHCDPKNLLSLSTGNLKEDRTDARDQVISDILRFSVSPCFQGF